MRLLYSCLDPGVPVGGAKGASVHVGELLRAFVQEDCSVALLARDVQRDPAIARVVVAPKVPPRLPARLPGSRRLSRRAESGQLRDALRRVMVEHRPELVYERYSLGRLEGLRAARRHDVPFVLEVNAPLAHEAERFRGRTHRRDRRIERLLWSTADLVVVPSQPMADIIRADTGRRQPVLVTPNAVDAARFAPTGQRRQVRERLGLNGRLVVGFAGTGRPWHDLPTLLEAVSQLGRTRPTTLLVIGERSAELQRALEGNGRHPVTVEVTGPVPHEAVPALLEAVDVAVATLRPDDDMQYFSPLKALEYLAAGRPTIVARVGDLARLADEGVALGYRAGDAGSLAGQLLRLAGAPAERRALGLAGREYAVPRSWRAVARAVLDAAGAPPAAPGRAGQPRRTEPKAALPTAKPFPVP